MTDRRIRAGRRALLPGLVAACVLICAAIVTNCRAHGAKHHARSHEVRFRTSDGWTIVGDRYDPLGRRRGLVLLLHQRGGSAADWEPLCAALQRAGIVSIAIDQRGTGRSTHGPGPTGRDAPWDTTADISAVCSSISGGKPIAVAGASYGANNALIFAAEDPAAVVALALFSPGANYHGLDALAAARHTRTDTAIFHYESDSIAGAGPQRIAAILPGRYVLHIYPGTGHGTDLLSSPATADCVRFFLHAFGG